MPNIQEMVLISYICKEKKEEEDSPALKITLHQDNGTKTT